MSAAFTLQPTVSTARKAMAAEDKSSPVILPGRVSFTFRGMFRSNSVPCARLRKTAQDYAKLRKNTQTRTRPRHNPRDGKARRLPVRLAARPSRQLTSFRKKDLIRKVSSRIRAFSMGNPSTGRQESTIVNRTVTPRRPPNADLREREYLTPEGSGPSAGCCPQTFPVWPPRRDRHPDRLSPWATRQRTVRIDLEYDRA
jgi:hypothetical protein